MNFNLNEQQLTIQQIAREIAVKYCLPEVIHRDENKIFPSEQVRQLAENGFLGLIISEENGGLGLDSISYINAIKEIAKIDASTSIIMSVNNSLVGYGLEKYGSTQLKKDYLKFLANGIKDNQLYIGAFLLSEPEAGSDATSIKTEAIYKGDYFEINGVKNWITNGSIAKVYILFAKTLLTNGKMGVSAFLVENDSPGITVCPPENKLGIRASDTCSIIFDKVKVPTKNLITELGNGIHIALDILDAGRIGVAAQALGIAEGAYDLALKYAKQRKTFGKEIIFHQAIQFKLVDMFTKIESAKYIVYKAGFVKDEGLAFSQAAAMAKLIASDVAQFVTTEAIQIHGGNGYVKEYHVERLFRDAKITQIYEGTSEIQKMVIGRSISK